MRGPHTCDRRTHSHTVRELTNIAQQHCIQLSYNTRDGHHTKQYVLVHNCVRKCHTSSTNALQHRALSTRTELCWPGAPLSGQSVLPVPLVCRWPLLSTWTRLAGLPTSCPETTPSRDSRYVPQLSSHTSPVSQHWLGCALCAGHWPIPHNSSIVLSIIFTHLSIMGIFLSIMWKGLLVTGFPVHHRQII